MDTVFDIDGTKLEFGKVKSYGAGRVYMNTLICLLIFSSNKNYITLLSDRMTEVCCCKNVNTALREIDRFVKLGFIERVGNKPIKSSSSSHYYWVYKRVVPETKIVEYNHNVIDNFNNSRKVKCGEVEKMDYINFGKEIGLRTKLLMKKRSPVDTERQNAEMCERMVNTGLFDEALEFLNEYSSSNPTLECNGWLASGQLRFSNNVCNTDSSFKRRCKEVKAMDSEAVNLHSYDANASIVRTAHFLTHDNPEDFNVDIYHLLMERLIKRNGLENSEYVDEMLKDYHLRKSFKTTVLPVFFRGFGIHHFATVCKLVSDWYKKEASRDGGMTCEEYFSIKRMQFNDAYIGATKVINSLIYALTGVVDPSFQDYYDFYKDYRDILEDYCHSNWFRKTIFVWESLHHLFILKDLTELGFRVYNVYDEELVVGGLPDGLYERVWMKNAKKVKKIYHKWIALEQERLYNEKKVQKQINRVMARQDKHIEKINSIVEETGMDFDSAKDYYLSMNDNVYMDGFLFCERRNPVEVQKLSAKKLILMGI